MNKLHLFNPENDLALASNMPYYTPPAAAAKLAKSACMLPMWYADRGDYVLINSGYREWCESVADEFCLEVNFVTDIPSHVSVVLPWGWSRYTKQLLLSHGMSRSLLPTDSQLNTIRALSHRHITIDMYEELTKWLPYPAPPMPIDTNNVLLIESELKAGRQKYIKSPWSGSGRGIIDTTTAPTKQVIRLAAGVIARQGSVLMEERLDKILDFAMLFDMNDGVASFVGYSVFFNLNYSAYNGNRLAAESVLQQELQHYVSRYDIEATRESVKTALEKVIADKYNGPLGVDMMIYDGGNHINIAPCIEVNLRMTMGRVAHELSTRHLPNGFCGSMSMDLCGKICSYKLDDSIYRYLTPPSDNDFAFVLKQL